MTEPNNIINDYTQVPDTGTWGSYNKTTNTWSNKVFSGKAIREWILHKLSVYGPYESIQAACTAIPAGMRKIGLTVGVIGSNGQVREYQWKTSDLTDAGLVEKIEQVDLTFAPIGNTTVTAQSGDAPQIRFSISGRSNISRGHLYQVVGQSEIFAQEIPNLVKGDNFVSITPPASSGTYVYRLRIIDSSGYYATRDNGDTYIDYTIKYGGITVNYNFTNVEKIAIKNVTSVQNQYFTATISVRDESFVIEGVYLTDGTHDYKMDPYKTLNTINDTHIGFNYYMLPDSQTLSQFDGNACYVKVQYTEDGYTRSVLRYLFTLLRADSLTFISQSTKKDYYEGFPDYYTLQLQSGISGISVYMQTDEDSDFSFDPVTISTYNNYSLRIIPIATKENAVLRVKCTFTLNNVDKVYHFEEEIGNIITLPIGLYYTPNSDSNASVTLDRIIEADINDVRDADTASYYKIVDDFTSPEYTTCAFILDTYCKINKTGINTTEYISIYQGNTKVGYVAEDVIYCNGLITDTPLGEWVQIGLGFNLEEVVTHSGQTKTVSYPAIYINGMVVKTDTTQIPLTYKSSEPITIHMLNGINVQKCFVYYKNNAQAAISPTADVYSIIYTNYLAHNPSYSEPGDLPVLKLLRVTDEDTRHRYFRLLQQLNEDVKHLTTFGTIGLEKATTMSAYDASYSSSSIDSNATLFRQSVDIKKPALKEYATLCTGSYFLNGTNVLQDCIIEVHTQGTSTLVYAVPNFKFTFWKIVEVDGAETLIRFYPDFILKEDGSYYRESIYTAKADFMDSSHLNNTPTCVFYNNTIQKLINDDEHFPQFTGSPSARNGGLDAIVGFPIVLEISDSAASLDDLFMNIGSFMLNIDKTGDSLGFVIDDVECLSLEGTSNDEEVGGAGRFVLPNDTLKDYRNTDGTINTEEIDRDAAVVQDAIAESGKKLLLESQLNGDAVKNHPYVKWCKFLSSGLEYRYPDSDIYKTGSNASGTYISKILKAKDFKKIYKMWIWVATSDTNSNYKEEFPQHFDLYYCMLYFIQLMVFAQTDNLGKNAMFDTWDGEHWYPRPYDLDSQAGLDNNGNDNIAPFVEIMPEFSLNYNPDYTAEQKAENSLLKDSKIEYARLRLDRYHFSSEESKLWINFYKNYKNEIEGFYNLLRNYGGYTPENIIQQCKQSLIDKLGIRQYNQDFNNKYLGTKDQKFAYGNRWYKFKKWLTQRFAFCDSYFGNADSAYYNLTSSISYSITVDAPQYVKQTYQDSSIVKFITNTVNFSAGGGAATKINLSINQDQVLRTDLFKYVYYDSLSRNYTNLIELDTSGNNEINTYTSLTGTTFNNLRDLKIDNSGVTSIDSLPNTIKTISAKNVTLQSVTIPEDCSLESVDFSGSTINTNVSFARLPKLNTLNLANCTFNGTVTLSNLESLENFIITGAKFNNTIIIQDKVKIKEFNFTNIVLNGIVFDGDNINISKLNFTYTKFGQSRINVNAISNNIQELIFSGCTGLTHVLLGDTKTFTNLTTLGLYGSSITALGNNDTYFDASKINNISSLYGVIVSKNATTGAITSTKTAFTFRNTRITDIRNLNWTGNCASLFNTCTLLQSVQGVINARTSISYMFYKCSALTTTPTINIADSVTTAEHTFTNVSNVSFSTISGIIKKCKNVTTFANFCRCVKIPDNTNINLDDLFAGNQVVTHTSYMFCPQQHGTAGISTKANKIKVSGKIPNSVTNADAMFFGLSAISVPYNIISDSTGLKNVSAMFASSAVTFYIPDGSSMVLPSYTQTVDEQLLTVTLTNAIDGNFFYGGNNKITTIKAMFLNSNVQTISNNVFDKLTELTDCSCVFYNISAPRAFARDLTIDNIWQYNSKLTTVEGCFGNVSNVYCASNLNFNHNIQNIKVSGLFHLSTAVANSPTININFDSIPSGLTWNVNSTVSYFGSNGSSFGVFKNRNVRSTSTLSEILSNISGGAQHMFNGSTLYLDEHTTTINLTNITDCDHMFTGCNTYKFKSTGDYTDSDRVYLSVLLPTNCKTYSYMFYNSNILNNIPSLRSQNAETLTGMFRACVFSPSQEIPANYLQICKSNVVSTDYMFFDNNYVTGLEYNAQAGLFSDCINLTNVQYMFSKTLNMLGGIPNNIFGSTPLPKIRTIAHMFQNTPVFYNVQDGSNKWIDKGTMTPLVNLIDISYLFDKTRQGNSKSGVSYSNTVLAQDGTTSKYVIDPLTFEGKNLEVISYAFSGSPFNVPFRFTSFLYGNAAFFASSVTEIGVPFIEASHISDVRSAMSMFERGSGSVTNLSTFINSLVNARSSATINNIAGGLSNTDIDETLRAHSALDYSNYHGSFF